MDSSSGRTVRRLMVAILLAGALLPAIGCNIVAMGLYLVHGMNVDPDYDGLKGKRVAVVCRPVTSLQYRNSSVHNELAKNVGKLLSKHVSRIKMIDQREISQWTDEYTWEEYQEIGKALDADFVVGLDLEEFTLYKGPTLYQGKASINITVYDISKNSKDPAWEKALPQTLYPPNSAVAASEKPESQFRTQFVEALAEQIARHFYEHDPTVDFSADSTAVK